MAKYIVAAVEDFLPGTRKIVDVGVESGGAVTASQAAPAASVTEIAGTGTRTHGVSGIQRGPYVTEIYPVFVDQRYVVVEVTR